ncbi:MAG: hypothetical protein LJF04_01555 [Gemmatimonadetes bacterium]|nr:hypothetical protein [Gemmatimonadota bacterium]
MRQWRVASAAVFATLAALALASCKNNDSTGPAGNADLVGSYALASLTFEGQPTLQPPLANGSLVLSDTTYSLSINITVPGAEQQITDAGTYTVSGSNWSQTSSTLNIQSVGTYALASGTLTVDVTTAGQHVTTIWLKQ